MCTHIDLTNIIGKIIGKIGNNISLPKGSIYPYKYQRLVTKIGNNISLPKDSKSQ